MLGSIPELPAETCKEIKASEGGEAVSGKYWFDSITPGETVLAQCDMEKEGNEGVGVVVGGGGGSWENSKPEKKNICHSSISNGGK